MKEKSVIYCTFVPYYRESKLVCSRCKSKKPTYHADNDYEDGGGWVRFCDDCAGFVMSRYSFMIVKNPKIDAREAQKKYDKKIANKYIRLVAREYQNINY